MNDKKTYIDFHSHTIYSDGTDSPRSLLRAMKMSGVDKMAITDHDTMQGYFVARQYADQWGIDLIAGVEVSTEKYHILGLHVEPTRDFMAFLGDIQDRQRRTCAQRIDILEKHGVPINMKKLEYYFPVSRLGKYNILMAMLQDPECRAYSEKHDAGLSADEIFRKYITKGGIASKIGIREDVPSRKAIEAIHAAGGIAVIAHPFKEVEDMKEMDVLREEGIDGLELQPNFGDKNIPFKAYAEKYGLLMTYGSDFHGPAMAQRPLIGRKHLNVYSEERLEEMLNIHRKAITC